MENAAWLCMCGQSGIRELLAFASKTRKHTEHKRMHTKYPLTSAIIEGCMNTIKVIKRTAWVFRDFEYFLLRVKYACLPYKIKQEVKDKHFRDCPEYLLPPIGYQKCGWAVNILHGFRNSFRLGCFGVGCVREKFRKRTVQACSFWPATVLGPESSFRTVCFR